MKEIRYVVTHPLGVHARFCALLVQCCVNFKSSIVVKANEDSADGRNVLELLTLRIKKGDVMDIIEAVVTSIFVIVLLFAYLLRPVTVDGVSMMPTLLDKTVW